ncbi:AlpA family phage regulatory protein [Candidatus Kaiserbacteria bacterium]|nr:AlpA family phage regulatory protein [Candidatus Kaiserbacteria bacterium]
MSQKRFVSQKELKTLFGIPYTRVHILRMEAAGQFPKRIWLSPQRMAWLQSEIESWIDERIAMRDDPLQHQAAPKEIAKKFKTQNA